MHKKRIFGAGMLNEKPVRHLIEETASYLSKGIERGIMEEQPSEAMVTSLRESAGVFSGFKTFHEMKEAASLLLDEKGGLKPFELFSNDVQKINDSYNRHYLKTEYSFAVQSAQMAARWEVQQDDGGGRYLLQYRTAGDKKVRPAHREMEGITLPSSDPFWDKYYPPNGYGCRCTVAKVRASKYPATDSAKAMKAGDDATAGKYAEMFRFNPGKQRAAYPAYNSYTISKCKTCKKNGYSLAKIPGNELCAACLLIQEMAKYKDVVPPEITSYAEVVKGKVYTSPHHGKDEREENERIARVIAKFSDVKVYLLPRLDPMNPSQMALRKTLFPAGVKEGKSPDYYINGRFFDAKSMLNIQITDDLDKQKQSIENRIKKAKVQADNIVLEIPEWIELSTIARTVNNYLGRSKTKRIILVCWNEKLFKFSTP